MEINKQTCTECGNPIEGDGLAGLCPVCMMQVGMGSMETNAAAPDRNEQPSFNAPPIQELTALFPQLEIIELIGFGGMGAVYKAHQRDLDRYVALKILMPRSGSDPGFAERFTREARALARLSHPSIIGVYDFGQREDLHYFIMEFVDGPNLRQVQQVGTLSSDQALSIVPQICEALQYAHDQGVVHRDIKPENILLEQKGRIKIADFGLAKILGKQAQNLTLTREGHVMGTPHYMAPEQVEHPHDVDHRADIYSLGVVFYEMLTGELPLGKFSPPSNRVQVDVRLDEVVLKTLEKEPRRRYQQVSQVATEVETISHSPGGKRPETDAPADALAQATEQLRLPAIGLIVTGLLEWLFVPLGVLGMFLFRGFLPGALEIAVLLATLPLAAFLIFAGLRIKRAESYKVGIVASVLATVVAPANAVGLFMGVWTFVVLTRKEVRATFDEKRRAEDGGLPVLSGVKPDWRKAGRMALWTNGIHALALILFGVLLTFFMQRNMAFFHALGASLPLITRVYVTFTDVLIEYGWLVLITVLINNGLFLWVLGALGGRRARRWWSVILMVILILLGTGMRVAIKRPLQQFNVKHTTPLPQREVRRNPNPQEAHDSFMAKLPQGTVELLGIGEHPSDDKAWWSPDGSPAQEGPFYGQGGRAYPSENKITREFVIRLAQTPADASRPTWKIDPSTGGAGIEVTHADGQPWPGLYGEVAHIPDQARDVNVTVGVALDPWETVATASGSKTTMKGVVHRDSHWSVSFQEVVAREGALDMTVVYDASEDWEMRVVAMTDAGIRTTGNVAVNRYGTMSQRTSTFHNLPLEEVQRFALQVRTYHWVTFEHVALQPMREAVSQNDAKSYTATLSNGLLFEVLAVARNPRGNPAWCTPDGIPLDAAPLTVNTWRPLGGGRPPAPENQFLIHYRHDISPMPVCESLSYRVVFEPVPTKRNMVEAVDRHGKPAYPDWIGYDDPPDRVTIRIRSAAGPWETIHEHYPGKSVPHRELSGNTGMMVQWGEPVQVTKNELEYVVMHSIDRETYALRVMAHLHDGRMKDVAFHSGLVRGVPIKGFARIHTNEYSPKDVEKFVMQRSLWASGVVRGVKL
jgi:predicted Ser/Thr protein kinase